MHVQRDAKTNQNQGTRQAEGDWERDQPFTVRDLKREHRLSTGSAQAKFFGRLILFAKFNDHSWRDLHLQTIVILLVIVFGFIYDPESLDDAIKHL